MRNPARLVVALVGALVIATGLVPVPIPVLGGGSSSAGAEPNTAYRDAVLSDSPYAYVPLDETGGTTAADASGNGRNATFNGGVVLGEAGPLTGQADNRAATFGAVGRYASFTSALVPSTGDWTVETWAQTLGDGINDGDTIWSQYYDSFSTRVAAQACRTAAPRCLGVQIGGTTAYAPARMVDGTWYHLVFQRSGSTLRVFVDTTLVASGTYTGAADTKATWIGGHNAGGSLNAWFNGRVAHFAVYRTALSPQRLRAHYAASGRTAPVDPAQTRGEGSHGRRTTTRRADPVDTATGAFVETVSDLASAAPGVAFALGRTYNSNDAAVGSLGRGWTHSLAASLSVGATGEVTVRSEDGAEILYTPDGLGGYVAPPAVTSRLAPLTGGHQLTRADNVRYRFDTSGRLQSVKDRVGLGVDLAYDASSRLSTATDAAGRVFTFSYNAASRLAAVSAPPADGRSVSYSYTGDLLTSVTDVRGETTAYAYDASGRLSQITDPEGNLQMRTTYDAGGRVVQQLDPLGGETTFAWDQATQTSTMTDPAGNTWVDVYSGNVLVSIMPRS